MQSPRFFFTPQIEGKVHAKHSSNSWTLQALKTQKVGVKRPLGQAALRFAYLAPISTFPQAQLCSRANADFTQRCKSCRQMPPMAEVCSRNQVPQPYYLRRQSGRAGIYCPNLRVNTNGKFVTSQSSLALGAPLSSAFELPFWMTPTVRRPVIFVSLMSPLKVTWEESASVP